MKHTLNPLRRTSSLADMVLSNMTYSDYTNLMQGLETYDSYVNRVLVQRFPSNDVIQLVSATYVAIEQVKPFIPCP